MKILAIGDVTSPAGVKHLEKNLWSIRKEHGIDLCVVNGENAAFITGVSPDLANTLLSGGADVITGGNHTLMNRASYSMLDEGDRVLRPINYGDGIVGAGYTLVDVNGYRVMVISAMGNVSIQPVLDSPFPYIDRALARESGRYDFAVLDIHAEATGEKGAIAYYYDGKINVIFGTHTHVQTADERILPGGSGFITDVGMCGESGGVLGMDSEAVIEKIKNKLPAKFRPADGVCKADGVIFDLNTSTGRVVSVKRISF